jgi:hypothetical protein
MRHFLTLLLLAGSSLCFGQIARDSEPTAPILAQVAAAQSHQAGQDSTRNVRPDSARHQPAVYICDSKTAKAYHKGEDCRRLNGCTYEVVKVTKKEAEEEYGRVKCQVCY